MTKLNDQYKEPCQECGTILSEDVSIEVWESKTNPVYNTILVCDDCSQTYANEYKKDGYISQGELDEIEKGHE
jgi:coenzyme F420-reducing hydrogenase beta subunit